MNSFLKSLLLVFFIVAGVASQDKLNSSRAIVFPDLPEYKTLKCDFHQHTVFSDGDVWPSIRVDEALKDGLDAISITDHLEYQPNRKDVPHPDRNRVFAIATEAAKDKPLMVINGSEITRKMPPGHSNAIFLDDANKLLKLDSIEVFREARRQGAFIFWNHPHWLGQLKDGVARMTDVHRRLLSEKLLDGVEVVNDLSYSDEALQIALDNDLAIIGSSDVHGLVDWQYGIADGGHRPVTLVFAKEKTEASLKEALFAHRTAVWFNDLLIGRSEYLLPLLKQSLVVRKAVYSKKTSMLNVSIENCTSGEFVLQNNSGYTLQNNSDVVRMKAHAVTTIEVRTLTVLSSVTLKFQVLNAVTAPKQHPEIAFDIAVQD
jgi:hypothetical protein